MLGAYILRPGFIDAIGMRQLAVLGAGCGIALAIYAAIFCRPVWETRAIAAAAAEFKRELARERAEMQTRVDFLTAEREIGLVLNEDVEFQTVLDKVLRILHHVLGDGEQDEIEIYLREREGRRLVRRAALIDGKTRFGGNGRPPADPDLAASIRRGRPVFSAQNGSLSLVSPLASDGEFVGVVRLRTTLEGDAEIKAERAERLARNLEEFSKFVALAVKTPNLYLRAVQDGLTGLATKRHFLSLLQTAMEGVRRYGDPLCLIMIDIDHFKKVNDTYGHLAGDKVLKGVAAALRRNVRKGGDEAGFRYGGEELGLLLPKTQLERATQVAERLRETVEARTFPGGVRVTISLGVALHEQGMTAEELIKKADEALYRAKNGGRNRVVVAGETAASKS